MENWRRCHVSLLFALLIASCAGSEPVIDDADIDEYDYNHWENERKTIKTTITINATYLQSHANTYIGYIADLGSTVEIRCNSSVPANPVQFLAEGKFKLEDRIPITWGHQTRSGNLTKILLNNLKYDNTGRYICIANVPIFIDIKSLVVTDPGVKIINWTCSSNDLELVNCKAYYQREAFMHTEWELTLHPSGCRSHWCMTMSCRDLEIDRNEGFIKCLFKKSTFSTNRYELSLTAGTLVADENYYHNVTISPHIAVLAAPELSVVRKQSSELQIEISYDHSVLLTCILEYSVVCSVEVQTFNSTELELGNVQEEKLLNSSIFSVNLTDLKPYTNYNISVKCKLDLPETLYSTSSNITTRTAQDLPEKAPTVEIDSYSIDDDCKGKGTFGVQLYWKKLPSQSGFGNGPILHYDVQLNDEVLNRVSGSEFSAHVCVRKGLTQWVYVYPVNKVGRGRESAKFIVMQDAPSLNSCMVKGEIIPGDNLTRSSELQINIITHRDKLQDYKIYSCVAARGVCQGEYAVVENPFTTRSVKNITSQYIRLDTLTTPYIENIQYGVSVNNSSGGITWIDCINTQQRQLVTDLTPQTLITSSEIELRWPTSCSNTPPNYVVLSVNYCLIEEGHCTQEECAGIWTIFCDATFLIYNLQYKSHYKVWFTTLNSTSLLKEPLHLETHRREMRIYEIALIILSSIILCVLLILLSVCIRRQRTLWKRYKAPLVVQVADLEPPFSDSVSRSNRLLSGQNWSHPYFKVSADYQTARGSSGKPSNDDDDWGDSQNDRSLVNRSKDYLIAKPKPIQHVELDTYQPNNTTPLQLPDNITTCNNDDAVSLISEESCSINSNGITSSDMCKYLTEPPPYLQLNYQTLSSSDALIECEDLPDYDVDYLTSGDSDLQGTDKYFLDSDTRSGRVSPNTHLSPEYVPADIWCPTSPSNGRISPAISRSQDALLRSDSLFSGSSHEGSYVSNTSCDGEQSPLGGTSGDSGYIDRRTKMEFPDDKLKTVNTSPSVNLKHIDNKLLETMGL